MKKRFVFCLVFALLVQVMPLSVLGQKTISDKSSDEKQDSQTQTTDPKSKLAPDLAEETDAQLLGEREEKTMRVIVQLKERMSKQANQDASEFPQTKKRPMGQTEGILLGDFVAPDEMQTKIDPYQGKVKQTFNTMGLMVVELPLSKVRSLAFDSDVAYISPDRPIKATGHIETTSGAGQIRSLISGLNLTGNGIGIAILDSGNDNGHKLNDPTATHPSNILTKNFTGQSATKDPYGHGTHVAAILSGDSTMSPFGSGSYRGIAPQASILNLRVLDANGDGSISNVIAALDWCSKQSYL